MISLLDTIGPAIWRASWQAATLALVGVIHEPSTIVPASFTKICVFVPF